MCHAFPPASYLIELQDLTKSYFRHSGHISVQTTIGTV